MLLPKTLLINPPSSFRQEYNIKRYSGKIPLGLAYIGAVLEENNYPVKILDLCATNISRKEGDVFVFGNWREISSIVRRYDPQIVGISCIFTGRYINTLRTASIVKRTNPDIKVVVGGMHPTIRPDEFLFSDLVDYVALGESDYFIKDLIEKDPILMDGIAFKNSDGDIIINPKKTYIEDLDSIPFPARDLLPMKYYLSVKPDIRPSGKPTIRLLPRNSIITSRGCPYNCSFCSSYSVWGRRCRIRSPENVVKEIEQMMYRYSINQVSFEDDNISLYKKRFIELLQLIIDKHLNIKWDLPNGTGFLNLDREVLELMKESGCFTLNLPIESGDNHILELMGKPHANQLDKVENVAKICKGFGINILGFFVIGVPGETKESIQKSIDFAIKLDLDQIQVSIATPYKGTRLYEEGRQMGYINLPEINSYKEFSADDDYHQLTTVISTPLLSAVELSKMRQYFYDEFNKVKGN